MSAQDVKSPAGINCFCMLFKNVYALEDNEEKKHFWWPFWIFGGHFFLGGGQDNFSKK